jgi:hypothetical protein
MTDSDRTATQFHNVLFGETWYGPSWRQLLEGVSAREAHRRPIPEAHTIAEIVQHTTTWHDVVRRRLNGETPDVTDAEDWPAAEDNDPAWSRAKERLFETGQALWLDLMLGELEHVIYHAGQVGVLRKAGKA